MEKYSCLLFRWTLHQAASKWVAILPLEDHFSKKKLMKVLTFDCFFFACVFTTARRFTSPRSWWQPLHGKGGSIWYECLACAVVGSALRTAWLVTYGRHCLHCRMEPSQECCISFFGGLLWAERDSAVQSTSSFKWMIKWWRIAGPKLFHGLGQPGQPRASCQKSKTGQRWIDMKCQVEQ